MCVCVSVSVCCLAATLTKNVFLSVCMQVYHIMAFHLVSRATSLIKCV